MQSSKNCKRTHNSCKPFHTAFRKKPSALVGKKRKPLTKPSVPYFEKQNAYYKLLRRVEGISVLSATSARLWQQLFHSPFFSMGEVLEAYYDIADELQKEAEVLGTETKEYIAVAVSS